MAKELAVPPTLEPTPQTIEEYKKRLEAIPDFSATTDRASYEALSRELRAAATNSVAWKQITSSLVECSSQYYVKTSLELFYQSDSAPPEFAVKPYSSYLEKTFRYTFIKKRLPDGLPESRRGFPMPSDYYRIIDDIVRTTVVVKFLDGVEFIIRKFSEICEAQGISPTVEYKCSDEGYFAAHFYFPVILEIVLPTGDSFEGSCTVEVQITTQLQEVLRRFLHFQYEKDRVRKAEGSGLPWQWRYREDTFFTNYLGHTLRSIEGQIMDARRRRDISDACN